MKLLISAIDKAAKMGAYNLAETKIILDEIDKISQIVDNYTSQETAKKQS